MIKRYHHHLSALVVCSLVFGCNKKVETSDTRAISTVGTIPADDPGATIASNALAVAYPGALALSVFPASPTALTAEEAPGASYQTKVADAGKRLRGEGDCFVAGQIAEHKQTSTEVLCYEFDSDMNPSTFTGGPGPVAKTTGTIDGTDGSGQACMVTFAKDQVDAITAKVDRALAVVQGLLCVSKKNAEAKGEAVAAIVPGEAPLELATLVNEGLPKNSPIEFVKANLSAVANEGGSITYVTEVTIKNPFGKVDSIVLNHTPAVGDLAENGVLSFVREPLGTSDPNYRPHDEQKDSEKSDVMTISYRNNVSAEGVKTVVAELNQARVHSKYEPLNAAGLINYAAIPVSATNDQISAIKYVSFNINPDNGAGNLSYWINPGGRVEESARGFLFEIKADAEGNLSGCGISGATSDVSIRAVNADLTKTLAPTRYWHPRGKVNTNPQKDERYTINAISNSNLLVNGPPPGGSSSLEGPFVTKQCFTQADGVYKINSELTTSPQGYDVIAGSDTAVRAPARPPERAPLPPPPEK